MLTSSSPSSSSQGGVHVQVETKTNNMPYSLWGKAKRTFNGLKMAARVDMDSSNLNRFNVDFSMGSRGTGLQLQGVANAETRRLAVSDVSVSQQLEFAGGTWTVLPRYNVASSEGNVKVTYGVAGASVTIDCQGNKSVLTIAKQLGLKNRVSPSISTDGDVVLEYRRSIAATGVLTTTVNPDSFLNIKYEDGGWVASMKAPMERYKLNQGAQFSIRRTGLL
jgi:hypothetical protein